MILLVGVHGDVLENVGSRTIRCTVKLISPAAARSYLKLKNEEHRSVTWIFVVEGVSSNPILNQCFILRLKGGGYRLR